MFDEDKNDSNINILDYAQTINKSNDVFSSSKIEEKDIIFIGEKGSGKSTIFNNIFISTKEKNNISSKENQQYTQTCGINFSYYKGSISDLNKKIIYNGYEIGGGIENVNFLNSLLTKYKNNTSNTNNVDIDINKEFNELNKITFVLVFDLGKPHNFLKLFKKYSESISNILKNNFNKEVLIEYVNSRKECYNKEKNDAKQSSIFPANIIVIGNKYDLFEKLDV